MMIWFDLQVPVPRTSLIDRRRRPSARSRAHPERNAACSQERAPVPPLELLISRGPFSVIFAIQKSLESARQDLQDPKSCARDPQDLHRAEVHVSEFLSTLLRNFCKCFQKWFHFNNISRTIHYRYNN